MFSEQEEASFCARFDSYCHTVLRNAIRNYTKHKQLTEDFTEVTSVYFINDKEVWTFIVSFGDFTELKNGPSESRKPLPSGR